MIWVRTKLLKVMTLLVLTGLQAFHGFGAAQDYFGIRVVDGQTGRGVPMVELQTTSRIRFYTDSNGYIAVNEPDLMGRKVWFSVASHGYEFPADGFGNRGTALEVRAGSKAELRIRRLNIAERLYRITGQGIYRDSLLLGAPVPIAEPLLNAEVTGQDSVVAAVYNKKVHWFWGDTDRLSYALGNFATSGAVSPPPDRIDPERGIELKYFANEGGFSRRMVDVPGEGVVWVSGLAVVPDANGRERMTTYYQRLRKLGQVIESGVAVWNDQREIFEKVQEVDRHPLNFPRLHPFDVTNAAGERMLYFPNPYPSLRVRADLASYTNLSAYEAFTCLKPGTRYVNAQAAELDRDGAGRLNWAWKKDTGSVGPRQQRELVRAGKMREEESPFRLRDAEGDKPVLLHNGSFRWNSYRRKFIMIASEEGGATYLGEVWYSEADRPEGPWTVATKIVTHANKKDDAHDFYNPVHHPFLDREGGRVIYFEGTYVNTFSGNPHPTPRYEYNQILYRLDLGDRKLRVGDGSGTGD